MKFEQHLRILVLFLIFFIFRLLNHLMLENYASEIQGLEKVKIFTRKYRSSLLLYESKLTEKN